MSNKSLQTEMYIKPDSIVDDKVDEVRNFSVFLRSDASGLVGSVLRKTL